MKIFSRQTIFFCVVVCANNFFRLHLPANNSFCVFVIIINNYYYYYIYLYTVKIHQVILCSKNSNGNWTKWSTIQGVIGRVTLNQPSV